MGHAGEGAAIRHLEQQGYRILAHDWRNRLGQIDIVAEDGDALVLVEVKARRGTTFGLPQEAVDVRKQRKLRMLLEVYRTQARRREQPCRIDVVALLLDDNLKVTQVELIKDAVQGE